MRSQILGGATVAILACCCNTPAAEPKGGPLHEPVDQQELHVTWRNLANEGAMFPLDMKDMPIKLSRHRQLFLDNYLIAESQRVKRQVHPPRRYQGNPLLTPRRVGENRWSSDAVFVLQVRQFETAPRFRMWYWSWRRV